MVDLVGSGRALERRTQEQRSAQMRERLLDATIECLVEFGYAGTTTPRVAAKAGVTRGAQVHHFRSKTDLVVAAIKHLAAKRTESALRELGGIDTTGDSFDAILDFLWEVHQGPMFLATAELWVAARTDRTLATELADVEPYVNNALFEAVSRFVPDTMRRDVRGFIYTAMDAIRGIVFSSFVDTDPDRARRRWDRAVTHLRVASR
jgi:AcrR family transcriptional regulator